MRGVNNQQKKNDVKLLLNGQKVGLVGLLKTKMKARNMGQLYLSLFKGRCFTSNSAYNKGGRIVLSWNPKSFTIIILNYLAQFIHYLIHPVSGAACFYCTIIYAENDAKERSLLWKALGEIAKTMRSPCLAVGDYNCVLYPYERIGYVLRHQETEDLQRCDSLCGFQDMAWIGNRFTWNNKHQDASKVFCKLDRTMINQAWLNSFPIAMTHFMLEGQFDHCPIVIMVYSTVEVGKYPFKYFTTWSQAPNFDEIVSASLRLARLGTPMYKVVQKMKRTKQALKMLNAEGYSDLQCKDITTYKVMNRSQEELQKHAQNVYLQNLETQAMQNYRRIHKNYTAFLNQKTKLSWCKDQDDNTSLFHQSIKARRIRNITYAIANKDGNWKDNVHDVNEDFLDYYENFVGSSMTNRTRVKRVVIEKALC